jgi:hypothetical protein
MVERSLADLLTAADCFRQVGSSLADVQAGGKARISVLFFLIGDGESFSSFVQE